MEDDEGSVSEESLQSSESTSLSFAGKHGRDGDDQPLPCKKRIFCPHCDQSLTARSYTYHKRLYYNKVSM